MCKSVFDFGWHLRINSSHNDTVRLKPTELLSKHLLRDGWNRPLQVGEAHHLAPEQMKQDDELPSSFKETESSFNVCSGGCGGVALRYAISP